jgi:hypothetical protein
MSVEVVQTTWVIVVRTVVEDATIRAETVCVAAFVMVPVVRAEQAAERRDAPHAVADAAVVAAGFPKAVATQVVTVTTAVEEKICNWVDVSSTTTVVGMIVVEGEGVRVVAVETIGAAYEW